MNRIGLTQRVDIIEAYGERRDCLDQNWAHLMSACGFHPIPLSNAVEDAGEILSGLSLDGIILTGGNDLAAYAGEGKGAPERDAFEFAAIKYCHENDLPVLGVCRGMQVLNVCNGGDLTGIEGHAGSSHELQITKTEYIDAAGSIMVNSFHAFGITESNLARVLKPIAITDDGFIEAFAEADKRQLGIMWHPEREDPFDVRDIRMIQKYFSG